MGSQDLQQARYDQLVRRVGVLYGGGSKVVEVLPEVFPVLDLENLPHELLMLAGWRTAMITVSRDPTLGDIVAAQLFNPVNSGFIAAVTQVILRTDQDSNVAVTINQAQLTGGFTRGLFRDSRLGGVRNSVLGGLTQTGPAATPATMNLFVPSDSQYILSDPNGLVVLSPGNGMQCGINTIDRFISATFLWRERVAETSELNF